MAEIRNKRKTILLDVDGVLLAHFKNLSDISKMKGEALPGVQEKIKEWDALGYNIILTTGRKESLRKVTERQLTEAGIVWDQMVMGLSGGIRYLVNDLKPDCETPTAVAINIKRNSGLKDVEIDAKPGTIENLEK